MGTNCSRSKICTESSADVDDTLLDWQLVTLPEEVEHQPAFERPTVQRPRELKEQTALAMAGASSSER
jgi:hypothetical protein